MARRRYRGLDHGNRQLVSMIMIRQKDRCYYCKKLVWVKPSEALFFRRKATLDHRVPIALGGDPFDSNVVVACHDCNRRKGSLSAAVYMMVRHNDQLVKKAHQAMGAILNNRSEGDLLAIRFALKDNVRRSKAELYESLQPVIEQFRKDKAVVVESEDTGGLNPPA